MELENGGTTNCNNRPFISVMVLCYNYGHLLGKALDACAAQTFRDFEIVMINNGSNDDTEQVYRDFCAKHPDIMTTYVFVSPNKGPANGWNEGIKYAHGQYVMYHDADDWMDPCCLEKMAQKAMETGADRVTAKYREVFTDGTTGRVRKLSKKKHRIQTPMLQGVIFKRSVILENNIVMPLSIVNDYWFVYVFANCEKNQGVFLYETVYNYYFNPVSLCEKIKRWGGERLYKDFMEQSVVLTEQVLKEVKEKKLYNEILYQLTKEHYYSLILSTQAYIPRDDARQFYNRSHALIKEKLPKYWKNPLIWVPIGNPCTAFASLELIALVIIERLHLYGLFHLAGIVYKHYSYSR